MTEMPCPMCGQTMLLPADNEPMPRYDLTPGGHADRHALVLEAAEQAVRA